MSIEAASVVDELDVDAVEAFRRCVVELTVGIRAGWPGQYQRPATKAARRPQDALFGLGAVFIPPRGPKAVLGGCRTCWRGASRPGSRCGADHTPQSFQLRDAVL